MELKYHDPIFITKLKHNKSNNSELFDKQLQTNKLKSGVTLRSPHRTLVKFFGVTVFVRAHQISPPLDQTTHKKKYCTR